MFGILVSGGPVQFPDLLSTMNGGIGLSGPVGLNDATNGSSIGISGPVGFASEDVSDGAGYSIGLNLGVGVFA